MESKKISFGFLKTKKQEKPVITEQREYIESVEENSIKIIGKEILKEVEPLIIPMKPNTLITTERLKEIAEKVESSLNEPAVEDKTETQNNIPNNIKNETLEQMAVRELLQESNQEKKQDIQSMKITIPSNPVLVGQKESSLDDYEAVPIKDFGMAMLRGMGWAPGNEKSKYKLPDLRPKGLGLGADKVISESQKKNATHDNDSDLIIVKNAFIKITTGKYAGCYGKVLSLDEDNGRVLVNIPIKGETISLSEFMMHPVSKSEFDKNSKVLNADTYEAYKNNERYTQKSSSNNSTLETASSSSRKTKQVDKVHRNEKGNNEIYSSQKDNDKLINGKDKNYRRDQDSSRSDESENRRQDEKRYSSNDSLSSDTDKKRRKKKYGCSSDTEKDTKAKYKSKSRKEKRDIDKKRKGKKKKRDRDRSPGYRKYKK